MSNNMNTHLHSDICCIISKLGKLVFHNTHGPVFRRGSAEESASFFIYYFHKFGIFSFIVTFKINT